MLNFDLSKRITMYLTVAVGLMLFTILATTFWMADQHNKRAAKDSQTMLSGGIHALKEELGALNVDYAWWDAALVNINAKNKNWLFENMGAAVTETGTMESLILVNSSGDIDFSWTKEAGEEIGTSTIPSSIVKKLVSLVKEFPIIPVKSAEILHKIGNTLFVFTIARVASHDVGESVKKSDLPFIIMARDISSSRLLEVGSQYLIKDLRFANEVAKEGHSIVLKGATGEKIGYLTWTPMTPGDALLKAVLPPLVVSLIIFTIIAIWVTRHLGKSVQIVERSLIRAQAAEQAKADFLSNISHELRTPMNGVLTMSHVLNATELTEKQSSMLAVILESGQVQLQLINEILDFSLLDSGALELEQKPFSLSQIVASAVTMLEPKARVKDLALSSSITTLLPDTVIGDPVRVRQIFTNLLSNAVKFTQTGSVKLAVSGQQENGSAHIIITVSDTGIGIAADQTDTIFERFWQVDSSKTRSFDGNGLGLANIKMTVEKLNGKISVKSKPGKGSVFTVSFNLPCQKIQEVTNLEQVDAA